MTNYFFLDVYIMALNLNLKPRPEFDSKIEVEQAFRLAGNNSWTTSTRFWSQVEFAKHAENELFSSTKQDLESEKFLTSSQKQDNMMIMNS